MKAIQIAAGCKTRIIRRQFSSLATTYMFDVVPASPNDNLAGTMEIKGSDWIFPKPVKRVPLQPSNRVTAGVWDTFFSVYVIPEVDVVVTLPSKSLGSLPWLLGLLLVVIVVAITLFLLT